MPVIEAEPDVAKKTAKKAEPDLSNRKPMIVQIRGTDEYKAWAEEFADKEGDTVVKLFDRAVRLMAETRGFRPPPKR